jgi:hypothetical protein
VNCWHKLFSITNFYFWHDISSFHYKDFMKREEDQQENTPEGNTNPDAKKVAQNPNPRANENIRDRADELGKESADMEDEVGTEITDGEDA